MGLEEARAVYNKDYNVMGGTSGSILNKERVGWATGSVKKEGEILILVVLQNGGGLPPFYDLQ